MTNTSDMIKQAVDRGNLSKKKDLVDKNAQYLESFKKNNHEEEYQAYTRSQP